MANKSNNSNNNIDLASRIQKELVEPNLYNDVKYNIKNKSGLKKTADALEILAYILVFIGTLLAFASGVFGKLFLSYISGSVTTAASALIILSKKIMSESKERTEQVNMLLNKVGIESIPDVTIDSLSGARMSFEPNTRMSLEPNTRMSLEPNTRMRMPGDTDEIIGTNMNDSKNNNINIKSNVEEV